MAVDGTTMSYPLQRAQAELASLGGCEGPGTSTRASVMWPVKAHRSLGTPTCGSLTLERARGQREGAKDGARLYSRL